MLTMNPEHVQNVYRLYPECILDVSRMYSECDQPVSIMYPERVQNVSRTCPECIQNVSRMYPSYIHYAPIHEGVAGVCQHAVSLISQGTGSSSGRLLGLRSRNVAGSIPTHNWLGVIFVILCVLVPECIQNVLRMCAECVQNVSRTCPE